MAENADKYMITKYHMHFPLLVKLIIVWRFSSVIRQKLQSDMMSKGRSNFVHNSQASFYVSTAGKRPCYV